MSLNPCLRQDYPSRNHWQKQHDTCLKLQVSYRAWCRCPTVQLSRTEEPLALLPEHETVEIYQKKGPGF